MKKYVKIYLILFKHWKLLFEILYQTKQPLMFGKKRCEKVKHDTVWKVSRTLLSYSRTWDFFSPLSIIAKHILHNVLSSTYVQSNVFIRHSQTSQSAARPTFRLQDWVRFTDSRNGQSLNSSLKKKFSLFIIIKNGLFPQKNKKK